MSDDFPTRRQAALALLTANRPPLNRRSGGFLGQIAVDPAPLSERQAVWIAALLERAGLPALEGFTNA